MATYTKLSDTDRFLFCRMGGPAPLGTLLSRRGASSRPMLLSLVIIFTTIAAIALWLQSHPVENSPATTDEPESVSPAETADPVTASRPETLSPDTDPSEAEQAQKLWEATERMFRIERVRPSADPRQRERAEAKKGLHDLKQLIRQLKEQGLEGEELYPSAESRLVEAEAEGSLKLLDAYRLLEEDLATALLDSMSPEERFEYIYQARRRAFGEDVADMLFFEKEAYSQYKLEEEAILEDVALTDEEKQAEINARRNALQVKLASRGSYVSFSDERSDALERRLREQYGDRLDAMSQEDRKAAILDLYRKELPPETMEKVEQVLAAQEERSAVAEAYRHESQAIVNDEELSFDEKQERLDELSAKYNGSSSGQGH